MSVSCSIESVILHKQCWPYNEASVVTHFLVWLWPLCYCSWAQKKCELALNKASVQHNYIFHLSCSVSITHNSASYCNQLLLFVIMTCLPIQFYLSASATVTASVFLHIRPLDWSFVEGIVQCFGKCAYLLPCKESDEKIDATLTSLSGVNFVI